MTIYKSKLENIAGQLDEMAEELEPAILNSKEVNDEFLSEIKNIEKKLSMLKVSKIFFLMNDLDERKNELIDLIGKNVVISVDRDSQMRIVFRETKEFPPFIKKTMLIRNFGSDWGGVQLFKMAQNPIFERQLTWIGEFGAMDEKETMLTGESMYLCWADMVDDMISKDVKKVIPEWLVAQQLVDSFGMITFGKWMDLVEYKIGAMKKIVEEINSLSNNYLKTNGEYFDKIKGVKNKQRETVFFTRKSIKPLLMSFMDEEVVANLESHLMAGKCKEVALQKMSNLCEQKEEQMGTRIKNRL